MSSGDTLPPIFIVDDSPDDVFFLRRILSRAGFKNPVITFEDAAEAIRFLGSVGRTPENGLIPAFIFTDLDMPRVDGLEFAKWVRKQPILRRVKLVMLTGSARPEAEQHAKKFGVDKFFVKFPTPDLIVRYVGSPEPRDWQSWDDTHPAANPDEPNPHGHRAE